MDISGFNHSWHNGTSQLIISSICYYFHQHVEIFMVCATYFAHPDLRHRWDFHVIFISLFWRRLHSDELTFSTFREMNWPVLMLSELSPPITDCQLHLTGATKSRSNAHVIKPRFASLMNSSTFTISPDLRKARIFRHWMDQTGWVATHKMSVHWSRNVLLSIFYSQKLSTQLLIIGSG